MRITPGRLAVVFGSILAAVIVGLLIATVAIGNGDKICKGVTVSGTSVGGLTKEQAADKISAWASHRLDQKIAFTALDRRWVGSPKDFGTRVDVDDSVTRAFAMGREGSIINRAICMLSSGGEGKNLEAKLVVDEKRIKKTVDKIAGQINRSHKNASLKVVDNKLHIEQDHVGIKLNKDKAARLMSRVLLVNKTAVQLPVEVDYPKVSAKAAQGIDTLLARFTTRFNQYKRGRTHNLVLSSNSISGLILMPGEEFSYNEVVGPRLVSRGYREAIVFVKGRMEPGVGGGICQVSSTLYNSVLLAGLKVVERGRHARTVPYVDPGRDATVVYGLKDFKFANSNTAPIGLISQIQGDRLTIDIYGAAKDKKDVLIFTSKPVYTSNGGEEVVTDAKLALGESKVVDAGARGVSVTVYRKISSPDGKTITEVVSRDKYPSQKKIVAMGSEQPDTSDTTERVDASSTKSGGETQVR